MSDELQVEKIQERWRKLLRKAILLLFLGLATLSSETIASSEVNLEKLDSVNECNECSFKGMNLEGKVYKSAQLDETDFSNANLKKVNLIGAYIHHSKFVKCNLEDAILKFTELGKGDFTEAIMTRSDLTGAKLKYADFVKANLYNAILKNTELFRANFRGANLEGVDFSNSNMKEVNLKNANIKGAKFYGAILQQPGFNPTRGLRGYKCDDITKQGGLIDDKTICDR
jgi:uncharacterized protein YjbI with pentapeptide repeats